MQETKDPAITLFGKKIPLAADSEIPIVSGDDLASLTTACLDKEEEEDDDDKEPSVGKATESILQGNTEPPDTGDSTDPDPSPENNVNPKTPCIDEENAKSKCGKTSKDQNDASNSQEKTLKKPDKILPCPRCNSMDTKFCYYNNYNVNQPRHFCKACQRYWTAGGTMRNVPVGAGRRKNKNSSSHYRHITISEALQAARIDVPNGTHQPTLKNNGRVLSFALDAPICDSMASVLNLAEKKALNDPRNGFHGLEEQRIPIHGMGTENGDDCSSGSSITVSTSMEEGVRSCKQEVMMRNVSGFTCLPGVPWPYHWNSAVTPPGFCPPGFPMGFYPAAYYGIPRTWNMPWFCPQSSSPREQMSSNSSILGKHSREGDLIKPDDLEKEAPPLKQKNGCVLVPKTLRIDDPSEAAKSSIWATLGIKNESISGGGMFKAFQSKNNEKYHIAKTSPVLRANPAALSRSLNFHETS